MEEKRISALLHATEQGIKHHILTSDKDYLGFNSSIGQQEKGKPKGLKTYGSKGQGIAKAISYFPIRLLRQSYLAMTKTFVYYVISGLEYILILLERI